jgi:putative flippase GtrA
VTDLRSQSWRARLWSRNAAILLIRNSMVSTAMFLLGLAALWLLVEYGHLGKIFATGVTFLMATSAHYALARSWVYRGTERRVVPGYGYFLINAMIGLIVTLTLFALLTWLTPIHYLVARVLVSVAAGLTMFLLNATLNFKRL